MKILLQILIMMTLISCSNKEKQAITDTNQTEQKSDEKSQIVLDTLLEYNSPDLLDMSKHQLFIDTTRSSKYYKQIIDWKPNEFDEQGVDYYFGEISKIFGSKKVDLMGFPRDWVSIHSLNNEYVAYNPINGIDWRFSLTDSTVNHYRIEADADLISKVISLKPEELILELRTIPQKNKDQIAFIRIKKTKVPHIYSFQSSGNLDFEKIDHINLITPIEHLVEFNLVVSDAPQLVHSAVRFDKVERDKLE